MARSVFGAFAIIALVLSSTPAAYAWGGKIQLTRKYQPGQTMVYETKVQTRATISSDPPALKSFLPPVPSELGTRQQNTVTVRAVHPDGAADVETRFDEFEFRSDLFQLLPGNARESAEQAQREFSRRMSGQSLTAHYDRGGRLLGFDGADDILEQLDAPLREAFRQILKLFLDQMGGNALYPDHRVKPGEEWKRSLDAQPTDQYPFAMEGENTLRYTGKTRYHGVKSAVVDFHFTNLLKPTPEILRRGTPLAKLEEQGLSLDIRIDGQGQGRVLLALADGRVLQNHSTVHQALTARLKSPPGGALRVPEPLILKIDSDTTLEVEGAGK